MIALENLKKDIEKYLQRGNNEEFYADFDVFNRNEQLQFCLDDINFILEETVDDLLFEKEVFFQFAYALRIKDA